MSTIFRVLRENQESQRLTITTDRILSWSCLLVAVARFASNILSSVLQYLFPIFIYLQILYPYMILYSAIWEIDKV